MKVNAEKGEKLATDLKRLVEDSEVLLQDSVAAASEQARDLRERLAHTMETAKAKTKEGAKATDELIHEYPYRAMGVALGVGVLIGWLVRRK